MCGISGFVRYKEKVSSSVLKKMTDAIRHRGPDDEGYLCAGNGAMQLYSGNDSTAEVKAAYLTIETAANMQIGLGFRRLAIIDLSYSGHQPMLTEDKQLAITFNGEIYNYKEIRKTLEAAGYKFKSTSDTEVILLGYRHWGKEVLKQLNGMFGLVIYDLAANKMLFARDRLGIKPFFYHSSEEGITWSSEIKSVLKASWIKPAINWQGLFANYQLQTTPSPETCFEDIRSLQPGSFMQLDLNTHTLTQQRYWEIPIGRETISITKEEAAEYLDQKLQDIVHIQLRSDVPVTSLMSGGIDSTTLTAICAKQHPGFHCYSLGFDGTGQGMDELPQAIAMAKMLSIQQHVHKIQSSDIVQNLEESLKQFEEPYVNLEPGLAASEYLHREGYKVVMNGLGADEVFGGYSHYLDYQNWERRKKLFFLEALVPPSGDYLKKLKSYFGLDTVLKYFINSRLGIRPYEIKELIKKSFVPAGKLLNGEHEEISGNTPESLFYYDLRYYIGSHHVYRDDLSAMKHSLEVRYPFLDHELIEWVASLPMSIRYSADTTKPLLKQVAKRYITAENMAMPKKGFNLPLDQWMKQDNEIINFAWNKLEALKKRDIFNAQTINTWWQKRNEGVYFSKLWQLVTTEVWLSEYIES